MLEDLESQLEQSAKLQEAAEVELEETREQLQRARASAAVAAGAGAAGVAAAFGSKKVSVRGCCILSQPVR